MKLSHIKDDVLNHNIIVHCIAKDCRLGAGVAKSIQERYTGLKETLKAMDVQIGDCIGIEIDGTIILNLITKPISTRPPKNADALAYSLQQLKNLCVKKNVSEIHMPLIGAGLDKLPWSHTQDLLVEIFKDTDIHIVVCHLTEPNLPTVETKPNTGDSYRIAVTGHRPNKFKRTTMNAYSLAHPSRQGLKNDMLSFLTKRLEEHPHITLISGMALGTDTIFAECAIELKEKYPNRISFEAHVPFDSQAIKWPIETREAYRQLRHKTDKTVIYAPKYTPYAMIQRNNGMITTCDEVLAGYDGRSTGGTYQALETATKQGKSITLLNPKYFE